MRGEPVELGLKKQLEKTLELEDIRVRIREAHASLGCKIEEEPDSGLLADALCSDCPIVGVTKGFRDLTGWDTESLLGQNCRVLLTGVPEVAISRSARKNLRDFCRMCRLVGLNAIAEVASLQPNSRRDGSQFMNFFMVGLVMVNKHPYIISVQLSVAEGLFVKMPTERQIQAMEETRQRLDRFRRLICPEEQAVSSIEHPVSLCLSVREPDVVFYSKRLQGHCMLMNECRTVMRREPEDIATNCLVFGDSPAQPNAGGLFFTVLVDGVTTFVGLPFLGFTRRKPEDAADLYPSIAKCCGQSVLIGGCGEAYARDQQGHYAIGFKKPPISEIASWTLEPDVPQHKRKPPIVIAAGDRLGCLYTFDGRLQLWRNSVLVFEFDIERPVDLQASYYPIVDVCFSAYSLTTIPAECPPPPEFGDREATIDRKVQWTVATEVAIDACIRDCSFCVTIADPSREEIPLVAVSGAFETMTGFHRDEILGSNCRFLNHGCQMSQEDILSLRVACETGRPFTALLPNVKKSGEMFVNMLDLRGVIVGKDLQSGKDIWYLVGIQADVTGLSDGDSDYPEERLPELREVAERLRKALSAEIAPMCLEADAANKPRSTTTTQIHLFKEPVWISGPASGEALTAQARANASNAVTAECAVAYPATALLGTSSGQPSVDSSLLRSLQFRETSALASVLVLSALGVVALGIFLSRPRQPSPSDIF